MLKTWGQQKFNKNKTVKLNKIKKNVAQTILGIKFIRQI